MRTNIILFYAHTNGIPPMDLRAMEMSIASRNNEPVYFIEREDGEWLHYNEKEFTRTPTDALFYNGKDGKAMAKLYLHLNQEQGVLKGCVVTEHLFVDEP